MRAFRFAAISVLLVALAEAGWWAAKNRRYQPINQRPLQQQSLATQPVSLQQLNSSQTSAPAAPTVGEATAETEQRVGPFSVAGKEYRIVLHKKKRQPETGDTVVAMEIRDAADTVLYQRTFPHPSADVEFSDAWFVSAGVLTGTNGTGLLVSYDLDSEPSAPEPESSEWYQVFGVVKGKFKPFSGPILVQGEVASVDRTSKQFKTAGPLDSQSDALNFKVWAHHFRLIYPVRVDWNQGKLNPAQACDTANAGGSRRPCQYAVTREDDRRTDGLTFVQLCPESVACKNPERVLVKKDSKVELLSCATEVQWSEGLTSRPTGKPDSMDDQGGISVSSDNVQLKVRVDGKEGWIHADEDFNALACLIHEGWD